MSIKPYPKYKDSGVEWLGMVPEGWEVKPLKSVASHNDETIDESHDVDSEILYVDISGVDASKGIQMKEALRFGEAPSRARRIVKNGDVIVSTVRTYLRAIAPVKNPEPNLVVSTGFAVIRSKDRLDPYFSPYVLSAAHFIEQVIARSVGVSYPAINASDLVRIPVPLPTLAEQSAIASFLDHETSKIDALIAEQEKLIELLKEKRSAVISHAVTKGLNPDVKMKDSGVEWLGMVPEHWEVKPLFGCAKERSERNVGMVNNNLLSLSYGRIIQKDISSSDGLLPESFETYQIVHDGDSVLRLTDLQNDKRSLRSGLVTQEGIITSAYVAVQPTGMEAIFFSNLLRAYDVTKVFYSMGGGLRQSMKFSDLKRLPVLIPPISEQSAIASFLDHETAKIDSLTTEAQQGINLLQERRSALISAAVTGQIDVRDFNPSKAA